MKQVEPKVFLLAENFVSDAIVPDWLKSMGASEEKCNELMDNDQTVLIELAARRCYKSFEPGLNPNVTKIRENHEEYIRNILDQRHGSVLEHGSCTFAFENVSRVFTHELVRHRAGTAFSQESLRYVRLDELAFWIPPVIANNPKAMKVFEQMIGQLECAQRQLAEIFDINNQPFVRKKELTSAFRRIAPIGLATGIVVTFNMRALRWIIEMRTSKSAEVEIRKVFCEVYNIAKNEWPVLFQDFEITDTDDGLFEAKPVNGKV